MTNTNEQRSIDLNCDLGEGFGVYRMPGEAALIPYITSANIACGMHAGDPDVMLETVRLCLAAGVRVGAHPGLADLSGFGRRRFAVSAEHVYALVLYQLGALAAIVRAEGGELQHVKPHGALYHMAAEQPDIAAAVADAAVRFDPALLVVTGRGSALDAAAGARGLRVAAEAFADRGYGADGRLLPRGTPGAVIASAAEAGEQALRLAQAGAADTLCVHGDNPAAPDIAAAVRARLEQAGYALAPLQKGKNG